MCYCVIYKLNYTLRLLIVKNRNPIATCHIRVMGKPAPNNDHTCGAHVVCKRRNESIRKMLVKMISLYQYIADLNKMQHTLPWVKRLVAGLSPRRVGFNPSPIHVRFVVGKVALRHVSPRVLWFCTLKIIPVMRHIHSFIMHRLCISATDTVVK